MANLTFKEAYDLDQARPGGPLGDAITSEGTPDYIGVSVPDPDQGGDLVDIGITLRQLRRAIDHPAYLVSGWSGSPTVIGTDITLVKEVTPPVVGFTNNSIFNIEMVVQKQGASTGHFGVRFKESADPNDTTNFPIWVPFAADDEILTRRHPISILLFNAGSTLFTGPPAEPTTAVDPYNMSKSGLGVFSIPIDTAVTDFSFEFVCSNDAGDGTTFAITSFSILGIKGT